MIRTRITREQIIQLVTQWLGDKQTAYDTDGGIEVQIDRLYGDMVEGTREAYFTLYLRRPAVNLQPDEVIKPADFEVAGERELPAPMKQIGMDKEEPHGG